MEINKSQQPGKTTINYESLYEACIRFIEHYSEKELFKGGLYDTQKKICRMMIYNSFSRNGRQINISITRQYGKSTIVFLTAIFLAVFAPSVLGYPINIGISVPQRSQSKQNMDKLRDTLGRILPDFDLSFSENNKTDVRLSNGSVFYVFSLEDGSSNESRTLHVSIVDEAHKINYEKYNREVRPMMSNTNGNEVLIGVGGTRICEFYDNLQDTSGRIDVVKFNFLDALQEKKRYYEETGDERHLFYDKKVNGTEESKGLNKDTDEFRTEYMLEWILGVGNYITRDELLSMRTNTAPKITPTTICYAGIDFAKHSDSSVLTIVTVIEGIVKVVKWEKLNGDYKAQFDKIKSVASGYKIAKFFCDSTGVGDGVIDFLGKYIGENRIERVVFTQPRKDNMYKNLQLVFQDGFQYYNDPVHASTFEKEMTDLQKEYKGNYLSVHHPEGNYHDDYPDSLALSCLFRDAKNNIVVGNIRR